MKEIKQHLNITIMAMSITFIFLTLSLIELTRIDQLEGLTFANTLARESGFIFNVLGSAFIIGLLTDIVIFIISDLGKIHKSFTAMAIKRTLVFLWFYLILVTGTDQILGLTMDESLASQSDLILAILGSALITGLLADTFIFTIRKLKEWDERETQESINEMNRKLESEMNILKDKIKEQLSKEESHDRT
ncbi:TPA: hypothetical protein ACJXXT_000196 [Pseudomonas aeruginosa]